jgi:integrase
MERRHRACKDPATKVKSRRAKNRDLEGVHPWNPFIRQGCWHWMASTRGLPHPFGGTAPTISIAKSASVYELWSLHLHDRPASRTNAPNWCKGLVHVWLRDSGVNEGKVFRRVLKNGARQDGGVVWYAVKRCAKRAGIENLAPHNLHRSCARLCHGRGGELEQIQFLLGHTSVKRRNAMQNVKEAVNGRFGISVASDAA